MDILTSISYMPDEERRLVRRAISFPKWDISHLIGSALILSELRIDGEWMAASILRPQEDAQGYLDEVGREFGRKIRDIVELLSVMDRFSYKPFSDEHAENFRRFFLTMGKDLRTVFVKLADKLYDLRSNRFPSDRMREIAEEVLEIYVPLAGRLGMGKIKMELEDLSFKILEPEEYEALSRKVLSLTKEGEEYIGEVSELIKRELEKEGIEAEVYGRVKNLYSIREKVRRYESEGRKLEDIHDILAIRVIVGDVKECYTSLGIIHNLFKPIPGEMDDYIANPKGNLYRSLHTVVKGPQGKSLEIQIRTKEMHRVAEYGIAAHWKYKEGFKDPKFEEKISWLRSLIEWHRELSGKTFIESIRTDILKEEVYVFTPKGEIKSLPKGSTPIDFAYKIHTELGHRTIGAKVNGKLVPLNYELKDGDTVEIIASKSEKGPSLDWLNPENGYVKTSHAREKIRQWFRKRERRENIERGKEILEKELKKLGLLMKIEEVSSILGYDKPEDLLLSLGTSDVGISEVVGRLLPEEKVKIPKKTKRPSRINILGTGDLLVNLAPCCNPIPGDDIIGFITRSKGITIHRKDCPNVLSEDEKERFIDVRWEEEKSLYPVDIKIEAWDRVGLLRDITSVISSEGVNIVDVDMEEKGGVVFLRFSLEVPDLKGFTRLIRRIEDIKGVRFVGRGS
ncbi:MAG: (p)ppGpp synthetase [Thermoplasmata archaeon]|nr:MAG: (p)ppGpp synthetase [Thermoplasmata archaeon]